MFRIGNVGLRSAVPSASAAAVRTGAQCLPAALLGRARAPASVRFMAEDASPASGGAIPTKLTFNLLSPHAAIYTKKECDMVIIPGAGGVFGVLPGHVPTISELKPGLLEVQISSTESAKYFVSSGFAFAHAVRPLLLHMRRKRQRVL